MLKNTLPEVSVVEEIIQRYRSNKRTNQYPPELKAFAMTLQFYSAKAYQYIRTFF